MSDMDRIEEWLRSHADNLANIKDSACFVGMYEQKDFEEPEIMLQIGAAICLNKPILLVLKDGSNAPPKLFQAADKVIYFKDEKDIKSRGPEIQAAFTELLDFYDKQGE